MGRSDGVCLITLNRPAKRNALDVSLRAALFEALAGADADDLVRAVILTGSDPAFCGGADTSELVDPALVEERSRSALNPASALRATRKPVIGAINGACITGGLELALACDFLIASDRASFADTHAQLGVTPAWGGTAMLATAIGLRRAKDLSLTGRRVNPEEALAMGLVNEVTPHDLLLPTAFERAARITAAPESAVETVLSLYDAGAEADFRHRLAIEREAWLSSMPRPRLERTRPATAE